MPEVLLAPSIMSAAAVPYSWQDNLLQGCCCVELAADTGTAAVTAKVENPRDCVRCCLVLN